MSGGEKPLLSVCCLCYKHKKFAAECINSIWALDRSDIEIIALDDGSPDESVKVLTELQAASPCRFELITQENSGRIGYNFNRMISAARGEFIAFISCDDALNPANFNRALEYMTANPATAFITAAVVDKTDAAGNVVMHAVRDSQIPLEKATVDDLIEVEYRHLHSFYLQGSVFRREIVDAVGGFENDMTGDDIILRNKIFFYLRDHREWQFAVIGAPTARYRHHDSNVHYNIPRQLKTVTEFLEKFHPDRPNPAGVFEMAEFVIGTYPLPQVWEIFTFNRRMTRLLLEPKIQNYLLMRLKREPAPGSFGGVSISVGGK